ncbi:hypothetical protein BJ165DRAFT_1533979 [Panaeolus papilionaceus]|nr:hypothetical protein BJ165DRAFT_1533979 [Panaeolus papilionaceus]
MEGFGSVDNDELLNFSPITLSPTIRQALLSNHSSDMHLPESKPIPSLTDYAFPPPSSSLYNPVNGNGNGNNRINWRPEEQDYNKRFTKLLEHIKSRYDPTVTTVAQGVLEWKNNVNTGHIGLDMQA